MNTIGVIVLFSCLILLAACTSTSTAIDVRDIDAVDNKPAIQPPLQEQISAAPIYQESAPRSLPIVERLFNQADAALNARQWEQAISLAEKGLRIERKEPRFYWVLASAYSQLSNKKQSQSFARQGLRYADKNSPLVRSLTAYLH